MARTNAADIARIVRKAVGSPDETELTDADVLRAMNIAQELVAARVRPQELQEQVSISTVAGTSDYELPAPDDVLIITAVFNGQSGLRMFHIDNDYYLWLSSDSLVTGIPEFWYELSRGTNGRPRIRVWPIPNGTMQLDVHYLAEPQEMVLEPEPTVSNLPRMYDPLIIAETGRVVQMMQGETDIRGLAKMAQEARNHRLPIEAPLPSPTLLWDDAGRKS